MDPIQWIQDAGAKKESDTERDGFLSYHAESHAVAVGLGAGFLSVVRSNPALLALVIPAITTGLRAKSGDYGRILTDVVQEPHYALAAVVAGMVSGSLMVGLGVL